MRLVMAMNFVSLEPQSRSIARLVASDVVKGPGVRRYLSFPESFTIFRLHHIPTFAPLPLPLSGTWRRSYDCDEIVGTRPGENYIIRHTLDDIQLRGNRTMAPSPWELYPFCSHPIK
jgi:hypothetical protein